MEGWRLKGCSRFQYSVISEIAREFEPKRGSFVESIRCILSLRHKMETDMRPEPTPSFFHDGPIRSAFRLAFSMILIGIVMAGCSESPPPTPKSETAPSSVAATRKGPGTWGDLWKETPMAAGKSETPIVRLVTSEGVVTLELNRRKAPLTVENFLVYAKSGFYDGTRFHRAERGLRLDAGRFDRDGKELAVRAPVRCESDNGLLNTRGTLAMARRAEPHSATSSFFVNLGEQPSLDYRGRTRPEDWGNCVFGRVKDAASLAILDQLAAVPVVQDPSTGRATAPAQALLIVSVEVVAE